MVNCRLFRILGFGLLVVVLLLASSAFANEHRYFLGFTGGISTISGGDSAKFTLKDSFGGLLGYRLNHRWTSEIHFSTHKNFNDSTVTSSFTFDGDEANATLKWNATRVGLDVNRFMFDSDNRFNFYLGAGGGLMMWEILEPVGDTTIDVRGVHNERVDFTASEIFLSGAAGFNVSISQRFAMGWDFRADYLTGAGAEFESGVKSARDKWQVGTFVSLKFYFGGDGSGADWKSSETWQETTVERGSIVSRQALDGDGDGVPNELDKCLDTPRGVLVDKHGCSLDTDSDGVSDGLDDCPSTDPQAVGKVDIYGCPVDSDFDGIPDYRDACPFNQTGAHVDASGCPIDSDADGVPDGLDDCPYTLYGVDVDRFGCIDLFMLSKPLVLNIDYPPGSFEIDPNNRERLKQLSRILNFVKEIRMEINGYTDNIGTDAANKNLSEKRARRVRDYLVSQGIEESRIKAFGKGENNFVASNQNAAGRAKNRRIEIIFFK